MGRSTNTTAAVAALTLLGAGCYEGLSAAPGGVVGGTTSDPDEDAASGSSGDADDVDDDGDPGDAACAPGEVGITHSPLRRLTVTQLGYTLQDLLGTSVADEEALADLAMVSDGDAGGFAATTAAPSGQEVRTFLWLAEELAARFVAQPGAAGCDMQARSCAESFAAEFGRRAFRRPLDDRELADLLAVYDSIAAEYDRRTAFETLVMAILASPNLLYLEEPAHVDAPQEALVPLQSYAVASRLSYFLWSSMPDDALLDAAAAGDLDSVDGVEDHARRMIADGRFQRTVRSFHGQWLPLEGLAGVERDDPVWTNSLKAAMHEETLRFAESIYLDGGDLDALFTARYTFVDDELAAFYGIAPPAEPFGRVEWDEGPRLGVLTQASFLAASNPLYPEIHRGLFVREHVLCDDVAELPFDEIPEPAGETRLDDPVCRGCHIAMDSIGLGFTGFDGLGRYTGADGAGELLEYGRPLPKDAAGAFEGVAELAHRIAGTSNVAWCVGTHWSRYATGRRDTAADACALDAFADRLVESEGDLQQLLIDIATSRWFRSRESSEFGE
jgi:hypothetical protein